MRMQKIIFADDDPEIRTVLRLLLTADGYETVEAANGAEAVDALDEAADLVILDINMPEMDGFTACSEIRKVSCVPILFLTGRSQDSDKTLAFSLGGDDYLVKPFSYSELISRVKALTRRYRVYDARPHEQGGLIRCCGTVEIDPEQAIVRQNGREVLLTDTEYRILLLLATHRKKVFSIQNIYESIWTEPYFYSSNNTVMVHIRNIRRKLGDDTQNSRTIQTVWGKGYRVE